MDSIAFSIGNIDIYWYSICILAGIIIGIILALKESKKRNIEEDFIINLIFWIIIIGIIGARIYYVLFNMDYYLNNPLEIIKVYNGGLAIHGGIIAGLITLIIYCKKHKVNILKTTDILVPSLIIAQAIGRWGNFFNQEAFGKVTSLSSLENLHIPKFIIDNMYIDGLYRQPTFLYESLLCLIGLIIIILIRKYYKKLKLGTISSIYLIWYGLIRLIIEYYRSDSLMIGSLKQAQIISIIFIISGIYILYKSLKSNKIYKKEK